MNSFNYIRDWTHVSHDIKWSALNRSTQLIRLASLKVNRIKEHSNKQIRCHLISNLNNPSLWRYVILMGSSGITYTGRIDVCRPESLSSLLTEIQLYIQNNQQYKITIHA